ncbi:MAG: hypothetical protein LQ352_007962 [Teloschistes flavicans]|nr:MAG: hypothetical protein LQ352_007962 [Teloschistes flavicans]
MDEYTADAFVNRDEPVPTLTFTSTGSPSPDPESKRSKLKESLSQSKLKEKIQDGAASRSETGFSLQDRLLTKLLQQVIPTENIEEVLDLPPDKRSSKYIGRPGFSIPLMTNNFRRFNSRIGIVFVFQTRLIRLLTWRDPTHTLSLLAVCTFICLDPYLLAVLPLAAALLFVMVPAYLVRHPAPPPTIHHSAYSLNGPPLAPARTIRPAAEMSKDFFRNMRDLQNSMDDFSTLHDGVLKIITPPTNFSNEALSSAVFLFLFVSTCVLFIASHLLPWRFFSLLFCWASISLGHPSLQQFLVNNHADHIRPHERSAKSWLDAWIARDIILDEPPESREVETFELQRRKGGSRGEWESWLFSPNPYDPLSPQRIAGQRPKGTRFFEDVCAPKGWEWGDKKWVLDLGSREWVEERIVQGVEVEVEGERWITDLVEAEESVSAAKKGKKVGSGWEEGNGNEQVPSGQWRRRRWIRMVRRKGVSGNDYSSSSRSN